MMGGDDQARTQVEAMGGCAVEANAGIEVDLPAAESLGLLEQPVEQLAPVSAAADPRQGREIVDVEVVAPGEAVAGAEAGYGTGAGPALLEEPDQPVTLGAKRPVDQADEGLLVGEIGAQRLHDGKGQTGVRRQQLADHARILAPPVGSPALPNVDAGGTELHFVRAGSGEPMLLIQGMSATHLTWGRAFLALLEHSFDCIVFDNRGMGLSGPAQMPFAIADLAGDAVGLLDALEIERVHIVGISMGGMIAQELALAYPERIRSLTLGATYCGGPQGTLMGDEDLRMLGAAMASGDREQVFRAMWEINLSPSFRAEESRYDAFREMAVELRAPKEVILQQMQACAAHDTSARLNQVTVPTQVIHGTADRLLGVNNGIQIATLIGIEPQLLDDVGHMFWWEQPERSAALIGEHAQAPA